jgi:hypothetical protein
MKYENTGEGVAFISLFPPADSTGRTADTCRKETLGLIGVAMYHDKDNCRIV